MGEATHTNKSIASHAKSALRSTIGKFDIPRFPGKPPRIKNLVLFSTRDKFPVSLFSISASAQELRSLDDVGKETVEAIDIASPRGVLEESVRCSDSETSSSKASTPSLEIQSLHNNASVWRVFSLLWRERREKSLRRLSSFPPLGAAKTKWKGSRENEDDQVLKETFENESCLFKPSWKSFTTSELQKATNNFSEEKLVGTGGFAEVYEGCLDDGQFVAIKRLNNGSIEERTNNFLSELGILVHIDHPNIAKLIGVGVEDDLHLVLRLSHHGSLSAILHGSKGKLTWEVRYKIAVGTAEGIKYLHESCPRRIIHRDIKTANILLTEDFEPEICDFGLAKWLPDQLTHHTVSCFEGTFGYLAPEYLTHGVVDEKTDVFAFGVLLLELISGRKALDSSQQSLVMWVRPLIERNEIKALVDPSLGELYDLNELNHVLAAASLCIQQSSMLRPKISEVIPVLKGEEVKLNSPILQQVTRRRTYSEEIYDAEEYNATRYLNDMNRHRQIALGFNAAGE